jgi:KUP system potassium uptake protein
METFAISYSQIYNRNPRIHGEAFFFIGNPRSVSPYIIHTILRSNIIYDRNIFLAINRTNFAKGVSCELHREVAPGLDIFTINAGYDEDVNILDIVGNAEMNPNVIFYGVEDISTKNFIWKAFSVMKQLTPSFVKFYRIDPSKLHGIITRVEM